MPRDDDFRSFVAARWVSLYRLACLLTGSLSDAEDLLQESLEKTYVRWARVIAAEAPEAYVRKVMVNTLISSRRRARWRREVLRRVVPDQLVAPEDSAVLDHELVWPIVCALPDRQRAVVVLRYYQGLSERQIAETLGCSVGSVKSQAHDALAALRRSMSALDTSRRVVSGP